MWIDWTCMCNKMTLFSSAAGHLVYLCKSCSIFAVAVQTLSPLCQSTGPRGFCASMLKTRHGEVNVSSTHGHVPRSDQWLERLLSHEFSCHLARCGCKALCNAVSPKSVRHSQRLSFSYVQHREWHLTMQAYLYALAPSVWGITCRSCRYFFAIGSHSLRRMGPGPGERGFVGEGCKRNRFSVFGRPRSHATDDLFAQVHFVCFDITPLLCLVIDDVLFLHLHMACTGHLQVGIDAEHCLVIHIQNGWHWCYRHTSYSTQEDGCLVANGVKALPLPPKKMGWKSCGWTRFWHDLREQRWTQTSFCRK